jgi:hypothetical protein
MPIQSCCRVNKGALYIGPYAGGIDQPSIPALTQWLQQNFDAGEAHDVELTLEIDSKTLPSMRNRGGGTACSYKSVKGGKLTGKFYCTRSQLLAIGAFGASTLIPAGTATNEKLTFVKNAVNPIEGDVGTFVRTRFNPSRAGTVTVTNDGGATVYVVGTDYQVIEGGLLIPPTSTIPSATAAGGYITPNLFVTYEYKDQVRVEGLLNGGQDQTIWISGFDDNSGNDMAMTVYRAKPMPKAIPFIKDDWAMMELEFELLPDNRWAAYSNESKYFDFTYSQQ